MCSLFGSSGGSRVPNFGSNRRVLYLKSHIFWEIWGHLIGLCWVCTFCRDCSLHQYKSPPWWASIWQKLMYACTQVLLDYLGFPTVANQSPAVSYQVILLLLHWKEVGSLPEFPPLVCPSYNPAKPQREMSTVSSKEIRKERGRTGTFCSVCHRSEDWWPQVLCLFYALKVRLSHKQY